VPSNNAGLTLMLRRLPSCMTRTRPCAARISRAASKSSRLRVPLGTIDEPGAMSTHRNHGRGEMRHT
jgi:hypothetical protein